MKLSIVTPSHNSARFIRETIKSVLSQQGNFYIEYIIVDNLSADGTKEIIEEFQSLLKNQHSSFGCLGIELIYLSGKDSGMYEAINKGFEQASGDIYAWINSDDIYLPGAFSAIVKVFDSYEDVHWLKGVTSYMTNETSIWKAGKCLLYTQDWINSGVYGREHYFIQQDSVFWRAWLWKKSGGIDINYKLAGDYFLWIKFSEFAPLITVKAWVSCFRSVKGQLSSDISGYMNEVEKISPSKSNANILLKLFFRFEQKLPNFVKKVIFKVIFDKHKFSLVLISSTGDIQRFMGKYYDVMSFVKSYDRK